MKIYKTYVPKSMEGVAKEAAANQKPHDICLECPFRHTSCAGPGLLSMSYLDWVEWVNNLAKEVKLTHAMIAEKTGLSKGTVDSVLSGKNKDIRFATMRDITSAVVGDGLSQFPCHFASQLINGEFSEAENQVEELQKELERALLEISELKLALEGIHNSYQAELETVRKDERAKIDFLKAENAMKDKIIEKLLAD